MTYPTRRNSSNKGLIIEIVKLVAMLIFPCLNDDKGMPISGKIRVIIISAIPDDKAVTTYRTMPCNVKINEGFNPKVQLPNVQDEPND